MLKVGITGGIGSGKSFICKFFKLLDIPIFEADKEAARLIKTSTIIRKEFQKLFGENIYLPNGDLNKTKLAEIIFNSDTDRQKVNSIVHPVVIEEFIKWTTNYSHQPYVLEEAALIFESNAHKNLDCVITVKSPINLRLERIKKRDGIGEEEIFARIRAQLSEDELISRSDFIINNDPENYIINDILIIHNELIAANNSLSYVKKQ